MLIDRLDFSCAFCGEWMDVDLDPSAGRRQTVVEDCQICCRPNVLEITLDADGYPTVSVRPES